MPWWDSFLPGGPGSIAWNNSGEGPGRPEGPSYGEFGPFLPGNLDTGLPPTVITGGGGGGDYTLHVPVVDRMPREPIPQFGTIYSPGREASPRNTFGAIVSRIARVTQARNTMGARDGLLASIRTFLPGEIGPTRTPGPVSTGNPARDVLIRVGAEAAKEGAKYLYDKFTQGAPGTLAVNAGNCRNRKATNCSVSITKNGRTSVRGGKWSVQSDGTLICCPNPRRMNPCNSKALNRAARRLIGFAKMEKRIHKALRKACSGVKGRSALRGATRTRATKKCCA